MAARCELLLKVASFCVLAVRDFYFVVNGCCVGESHPPSPELSDTILVMVGRWSGFTSVFTEVVPTSYVLAYGFKYYEIQT